MPGSTVTIIRVRKIQVLVVEEKRPVAAEIHSVVDRSAKHQANPMGIGLIVTNKLLEGKMAVKVDKEKCTGCAACKVMCPIDAIEMKNGKAQVSDTWLECGACISECPQGALSL